MISVPGRRLQVLPNAGDRFVFDVDVGRDKRESAVTISPFSDSGAASF